MILAVVALLASCAGMWAFFAASSSPALQSQVVASPPPGKRAFVPPPPPPPLPQPVPEVEELDPEFVETWTRAHDRADWVGGAVVTCVLPEEYQYTQVVFADMGQGLALQGRVDVMSRFLVPVEDGRIHLVVTEPGGEALLQMIGQLGSSQPGSPRVVENDLARIRWSNAQPGTTVGCDAVWEVGRGTLTIRVPGFGGQPQGDTDFPDPNVADPPLVLVHGCGVAMPVTAESTTIQAEPGPCTLRADRRSPLFPFVVARGEPVPVYVESGGYTSVTLDMPPEPPTWQPPELTELATVADMAGFMGADAMADAVDELIRRITSGEFTPDDIGRLLGEPIGEARPQRPDPHVEETHRLDVFPGDEPELP
jgi:hypothetical protein